MPDEEITAVSRQPSIPEAADGCREETTRRQKVLLIAFGVVVFILLAALIEGTLSLFNLGDPRQADDPFVGFVPGRDLFALETRPSGEKVYATSPDKLAFFNAQEFSADKKKGTYRIFGLGGSTTAGRPYDAEVAFPRWLERYLTAMDPSRRYEVINAGAISYASYRVVVLMRELVRYEPDLFVIYTGHNEFLEERSYGEIIHQNLALKKLQIWLSGFRSFTLARQAWHDLGKSPQDRAPGVPAEVNAKLDGWTGLELYHRDDELQRAISEHFEYNLYQMAAIARRHGVALILIKPASNIKDFSPFKSEHATDFPKERGAVHEGLLAKTRRELARSRPVEALPNARQALELDPEYAEAHFRLGQALLQSGESISARQAFIQAKDLDVAPLRALERIAETVAEVAADRDIPLIDLPSLLEQDCEERFGHRILGQEYFLDHVHPDIPYHSLIALELSEILVDQGVVSRAQGWSDLRQQEIYEGALSNLDPAYYAQRDLNLSKVLGWAGKLEEAEAPLVRAARVLVDHPEVHLNLGIIYQRTGRLQAAQHELEQAIELDPFLPQAYFNLGVVRGRTNQIAAGIEALEKAIALRDDYTEARFNLGVLYLEHGIPEKAVAELTKVIELKGGSVEVYRQLGAAYRQEGRFEEAESAFQQALATHPEDAEARTGLAITYARRGLLTAAENELRRVLAHHADEVEALYNLGRLQVQQGKKEEALSTYQSVLEKAPNHVRTLNNQGILLAERGRLEEARQSLSRAIAAAPAFAEARFNLGVVLDGTGQPQAALRAIAEALELEPENGRFHYALGTLYLSQGEQQLARHHLQQAAQRGVEIPPELEAGQGQ